MAAELCKNCKYCKLELWINFLGMTREGYVCIRYKHEVDEEHDWCSNIEYKEDEEGDT